MLLGTDRLCGPIVVVGSYNKSLTVFSERLPRLGETVSGTHADIGPGGKGCNQAIGAHRLGADVRFVVKVGDDIFGAEARELLATEGLGLEGVLSCSEATGLALILVDAHGNNVISIAAGANADLDRRDLERLDGIFERASFLLCQLECTAEVFIAAAEMGESLGVKTVLNPAPAAALADEVWPLIDLLTPNRGELEVITGDDTSSHHGIVAAARTALDRGVGEVVVTLGEHGAVHVTEHEVTWFDAYPVQVRDTTGAGDAFNAGLVTGLASGLDMPAAVDLGLRCGAFCATRESVIAGLARRSELDATIPTRLA